MPRTSRIALLSTTWPVQPKEWWFYRKKERNWSVACLLYNWSVSLEFVNEKKLVFLWRCYLCYCIREKLWWWQKKKTTICDIAYLWIKTTNLLVVFWSKCYIIKQLLTIEALDMMWYWPENTNIDLGFASANIGILWSISHHIQCLNSQ